MMVLQTLLTTQATRKKGFVENKVETSEEDVSESFGNNTANKNDAGPCVKKGKNGNPQTLGIGNDDPQLAGITNGVPQPVGIGDGDPQPEGTNNSNVESSFQCGGLVDISEDGNLSPSLVHWLRDQYLDHLCSLFEEQRLITRRHVAMLSKADIESLSLCMGDRNMLRNLVAALSSSLHEATSDSNRQSAVSTSTRSRSTSASSSSRNFVADNVFLRCQRRT